MRIDRIKFVCELTRRDWTIKQLSEVTGLSRNTLTAIKSGKSCTESTAKSIAKALQLPLSVLTAEEE